MDAFPTTPILWKLTAVPPTRPRRPGGVSSHPPPPLPYYPHLDGLRAVALALVLAFHFAVPGGGGGYVGVDVFLVLSGYLMTRSIRGALKAGTFSVAAFLTSRFWRLYPAALATAAASVAAAGVLFPPLLAARVGASAAAAAALGANVYFWAGDDYWDVASGVKPLLHMWSLSLEEQFYILYPLALVVLARPQPARRPRWRGGWAAATCGGGRWSWRLPLPIWERSPAGKEDGEAAAASDGTAAAVGAASATSLLLAALPVIWPAAATVDAASAAFYLLPARVWEFGAGAALALLLPRGLLPAGPSAEVVAAAGTMAIAAAALTCQPGAPVAAAAPAVAGTAALIATPASIVGRRVLGHPAARAVGRCSYAAYLVHWPLVVYGGYVGRAMGARWLYHPAVLAAATAGAAVALRAAVEAPLRRVRPGDAPAEWRRRARMGAAAAATAGLVGWCAATGGWAGAKASQQGLTVAEGRAEMRAKCVDLPHEPGSRRRLNPHFTVGCIVSPGGALLPLSGRGAAAIAAAGNATLTRPPPVVAAVVGNSFSRHLVAGIAAATPADSAVLVSYRDACPFSTARLYTDWAPMHKPHCAGFVASVWEVLRRLPPGTPVLVANDWIAPLPGLRSPEAAAEVVAALTAAGLAPIIVGSPPIMSREEYDDVFPCLDFRRFVLWPAALRWWGRRGGERHPRGRLTELPSGGDGGSACPLTYRPRVEMLVNQAKMLAAAASPPTDDAPAFRYINLLDAYCTRTGAAASAGGASSLSLPPPRPAAQDPDEYACPMGEADPVKGAYVIYYEGDGLHLTIYGSKVAARSLREVLGGGPPMAGVAQAPSAAVVTAAAGGGTEGASPAGVRGAERALPVATQVAVAARRLTPVPAAEGGRLDPRGRPAARDG